MVRISPLVFEGIKNKKQRAKDKGLRTRVPNAEKDSRLKNYSTFLEASLLGKISLIAGAPGDGGQGQGYKVGARMSMRP